jgi:Raf kinase inhibitor-like YbhB/YbcL family protein
LSQSPLPKEWAADQSFTGGAKHPSFPWVSAPMLEKIPESVGEALHNRRAGLEQIVIRRLHKSPRLLLIGVSSSAFAGENTVPAKYTADGAGVSPPLEWTDLPPGTSSVAVIVEDADSPTPHPLVHAIVVNLDPRESSIVEGALDSPDHPGVGLSTGPNSFLSHTWLPPDPPPGHGPHRYVFQVFALRGAPFKKAPGREELFRAINEFGIGAGCVIATYERAQREKSKDADILGSEAAPA